MAEGTLSSSEVKKQMMPFRLSLRYKLAFPVVLFVSLMLSLLFYTTFRLVRGMVVESIEERLTAVTSVFTEALKVPLILENREDLQAIMEWMGKQEKVLEVRVVDWEGNLIASVDPDVKFPDDVNNKNFLGVRKISSDAFVVAAPIQAEDRILGRALVLFSELGVEEALKRIFQERLLMAFLMMILLSLLTSVITWIGIRPLFVLEKAAKRILAGDLSARAAIHSFDEIEDLGGAFNEMVSRLAKSLDRLRSRTEALEESEEKYRLVIDNASDIIFTLMPDGELDLLNRGFSGFSREELLREGLSLMLSLHTKESRKTFQDMLESVMRHKNPVSNISVTHILRGTKSEIFYLVNLTPVLDHQGEVKLIQGVMRDVTELRRIEMMKESLIRDVAHELKTPAAKFEMALNWFESEMDKYNERGKYQGITTILKNNIDRLMHTISSVMDLSKLESGMEQITKVALDLNEVLKPLSADMEPLVKAKGLEFGVRLWREPLRMYGDAHMLYRLFSNLIQNAIKYTEVGKITLTSAYEDGQIHVQVSDTGIGIETEDLETIFERFVQKTAASVGIGVGLTICRDIVTLHDGTVWAASKGLGKGSVFHVILPFS